jgi:lipopolysaccharide export system permease protein
MYTIDRYLIRQFLRTFLMTFVCLFGIFVIAEFVTNLAEFMRYRQTTDNYRRAVCAYYASRVPLFFELAGGVVGLLSAVFVVSTMQRYQELTALQAAGISRWRIIKPLVACMVGIAGLGVINREVGLPRVRDHLLSNIRQLASHRRHAMSARYDHSTDILFDGTGVHAEQGTIVEPKLRLPFDWPAVGNMVTADRAVYRTATADLPAGYLLEGVQPPLTHAASVVVGDQPIVLAPADTPWLESGQCFVVSALRPIQLRGDYRWQQYGSTLQVLGDLREAATYRSEGLRVMLHSRFVRPFLDLTMLFLGLPVALTTQRHHIVLAAVKTVGLAAFISLVMLSCQGLGIQGLVRPELAAWLPLMILVPLAILGSRPIAG